MTTTNGIDTNVKPQENKENCADTTNKGIVEREIAVTMPTNPHGSRIEHTEKGAGAQIQTAEAQANTEETEMNTKTTEITENTENRMTPAALTQKYNKEE